MSLALTKDDVERRVEDWIDRLNQLYHKIEHWHDELPLELQGEIVHKNLPQRPEPLLAQFAVEPRRVPSLSITNKNGRYVFIPSAIWIVGANGRINVSTPNEMLLLIDLGGFSDLPSRWVLVESELKDEFQEFNQESFTRLMAG